jgi:DMSO/TMAO reductase YedYZ heme-binding membrane subunit
MLLHPVFPVVPKFYESGVSPSEAFITIQTTFNPGVLLGMLAWSLLLTIGITAPARNRLPMTYKRWREFHGMLGVLICDGRPYPLNH